jgi:hypothetical protein
MGENAPAGLAGGEERNGNAANVKLDPVATENDAPAAAMTGCAMTIAATQFAEVGRDDEARRLACSSANVLQSAAECNSNLSTAMNGVYSGNTNSNSDWKMFAGNAFNGAVNRQVMNVEAPATDLCGALNGKVTQEQRRAAIEQARAAATTGYLENRRLAVLARKLSPELLARVGGVGGAGAEAAPTPIQKETDRDALATRPPAASPGDALAGGVTRGSHVEPKPADAVSATGAYRTGVSPRGATVETGRADAGAVGKLEGREGKDSESAAGMEGVLVSILVADTSEKTLEGLRAVGVKVEAVRAEASVVVGLVAAAKLEELALLESVRRVEMVGE